MANRDEVHQILNYLMKKRGYVVVGYKPNATLPAIGALLQEWSAHLIDKLIRVRSLTDKRDWDEQCATAKRRFPKILQTTEADRWTGGTFYRAKFGRRALRSEK